MGGVEAVHIQKNKKDHVFEIILGEKDRLHIKTHKNIVSVKFELSSTDDFADSVGLMGDWKNGTRLARDGVTVMEDDNAFGQEWQCRDTDPKLFMTDRAPQYPAACEIPSGKDTSRRLLDGAVSTKDAEKACAHLKEKDGYEQCVYDVVATQDVSLAVDC